MFFPVCCRVSQVTFAYAYFTYPECYERSVLCLIKLNQISILGRRAVISGELDKAIELYDKCEQSPIDWIQVYHLCYWEKMWCYAMLLNWEQAASFANVSSYFHSFFRQGLIFRPKFNPSVQNLMNCKIFRNYSKKASGLALYLVINIYRSSLCLTQNQPTWKALPLKFLNTN